MKPKIFFVPFHPSHLRKNRLLLRHLNERDCQIDAICVDELYSPAYATRKWLKAEGYAFRVLRGGGFRSTRHWIFHVFQRRELTRNIRLLFREVGATLLLICADNDLPAKTFVRVAKELGIPTILIFDGLEPGRNSRYRLTLLPRLKACIAEWVFKRLNVGGLRGTSGVDRILVMNEGSREQLVEYGVDRSRVLVVGSPEYEALATGEGNLCGPDENPQLRATLGIEENRPIVLFAHQSLFLPKSEERALIRQMLLAVRDCEGTLLVKLHPRSDEDPDEWGAWARLAGFTEHESIFIRDWSPSIDTVRQSAACVTVYSTMAVEVLILGVPLILIQYLNTESVLPFGQKYGAALSVWGPEELRDAIVRAVTDDDTRARLRKNGPMALVSELGGFDGRSLERSSEAIFELLRRTRSPGLESEAGESAGTSRP